MAAMTTVLTEFSNNGNSRTSTLPTHTVLKPCLVIEKRKLPATNVALSEYDFKVLLSTVDADGNVLTPKVVFEATVRYPVNGQSTEINSALATFRSIVNGDEFANSILTQNWLT